MTIVGDLTTETISLIFKECEKEKNKNKKGFRVIFSRNRLDHSSGRL